MSTETRVNLKISAKVVPIRNRDIRVLREIWGTMEMVRLAEGQIDWQRERLTRITQRYSAMPGGKGGVPAGFEDAFAAISEAEEALAKRIERYCEALRAAEMVLKGIEDAEMRAFVEMKYVFHLSNLSVMTELNMTDYAFKRARAAVEGAQDMAHVRWPKSL